MRSEGIGRLLGELRKDAGISQNKLCSGVCSRQKLSCIENEESIPDIMLLEILFQRLGKSPEKLEIILSCEEYERIEQRDRIENAIRFGSLTDAEKELADYMKKYEGEGGISRIYGYRIHGIVSYERGLYENAQSILYSAVTESIPKQSWRKMERYLLSTFEMENFILLMQVWIKLGKVQEAKEVLEQLHRYAKNHIEDEEEIVKVQSKTASLLGDIYNKERMYQKCIDICEPVFELERELYMIQAMSLLMDNLITAYTHIGNLQKVNRLCIWRKTLESIFASQGLHISVVNGMYFNACTRQYFLDGELIRGERHRKRMTQEQLCEGIYEYPGSLSKVENGKESPNRVKFGKLMEKLGVNKARYNAYLATYEYAVMEIDARIEKMISRNDFNGAKKEIERLERHLDLDELENVQLLQRRKNMLLEQDTVMTSEQVKTEAENMLALTFEFRDNKMLRVPFRNEAYLYNQICLMLWKMKEKEKCVEEYARMVQCFMQSRVNVKYHFRSLVLLLLNMSDRMERIGNSAEAVYWTKFALTEVLKNGKGTMIESFLANLVCDEHKKGSELSQDLAKLTFHCSDLFKRYPFQKVTQKYIYDNFDVLLDMD